MRDKSSPGVDTSGWATILPGATPTGTPAPRESPAPAEPTVPPVAPAPTAAPAPQPPLPQGPPPVFGGPPAFGTVPGFGTASRFGIAPAMAGAVGTAPNPLFGQAPPAAFSPGMPNPAFPAMSLPFAPPPKRTNPAVVIACIVGGVLLVMILAAVAIPVFLSQQKPKPVTLTIPDTLEGASRVTSVAAQQATSMIVQGMTDGERGFANNFDAGLYGAGTSPGVLVATGKLTRRPTSNDRSQFFHGFEQGLGDAGSVSFANVPPGPLGGTTECGLTTAADTPAVMCISIDNSAMVFVAVYTSDVAEGTMTALQVRSDVEHK